jgi:hypothetical protein
MGQFGQLRGIAGSRRRPRSFGKRCAAVSPATIASCCGLHLQQIDAINAAIGEIDQEADAQVEPFRIAIQLLTTSPASAS